MSTARAQDLLVLDNGEIRVGVDRQFGGAITHVSWAGERTNLINLYDMGRQVQQSYYAGPEPYGASHPDWLGWPWNPIGAGDVYGNASQVIDQRLDADELYVRSVPLQWALDGVPGECTFETWVRLEGHVARVRCRLVNARADHTTYPARHQELPAVYTVGTLHRLVTYRGCDPFTGAPSDVVDNSGPPWEYWTATESWAALLGDDGVGLGVVHPGVLDFLGGFHGVPGQGGPHDAATGYVAPLRTEVLDHDAEYEYEYCLVLGDEASIRAVAGAERVASPLRFDFSQGRQHWYPALEVPGLESPALWWPSSGLGRVTVGVGGNRPLGLRLRWRTHDQQGFPEGQLVEAQHVGHVAVFDPPWSGIVTGVRVEWDESCELAISTLIAEP